MESLVSKEAIFELNMKQQKLFSKGVPVLIIFEGSSGRVIGRVINEVIRCLEPRGIDYYHFDPQASDGPSTAIDFLKKTPSAGRISLYDRSWYSMIIDRHEDDERDIDSILTVSNNFERYLKNNGIFLIKIILKSIPDNLEKYGEQYVISDAHNDTFLSVDHIDPAKYRSVMSERILNIDETNSEWDIIDVTDLESTVNETVKKISDRFVQRLDSKPDYSSLKIDEKYPNPRVKSIKYEDFDDYQERLTEASDELNRLQIILAKSDRSMVLCFEGRDAAGKGSSIKHICHALNPRGYTVFQTSVPSANELSHTYLWRFCKSIPEKGHISIYDRTWYGRMLVEPVENLCSNREYGNSSHEIQNFEKILTNNGAIVLKFWLDISCDEQLLRFKKRSKDPSKKWKLTEDDWKNRDKWDKYDKYIDAMIESTNTENAPWIVINSMNKKYARVKILETIVESLKNELLTD